MRLRSVPRYLRFALGLAPRNEVECSMYLRHIAAGRLRRPAILKMDWGEFAYTDIGITRSQFEEIFVRRNYAFDTLSPNPVIVDCGGNVGSSAVWLRLNYPGCELVVYEADPELASIRQANLARAFDGKTEVRNSAVWVEDTKSPFIQTGADTGKIDAQGACKVKAIDLVEHLPKHVHLLKMDVEGAEFDVIGRLLSSGAIDRIDNLAVEFHPCKSTSERMLRIFQQMKERGMSISFESIHGPYLG